MAWCARNTNVLYRSWSSVHIYSPYFSLGILSAFHMPVMNLDIVEESHAMITITCTWLQACAVCTCMPVISYRQWHHQVASFCPDPMLGHPAIWPQQLAFKNSVAFNTKLHENLYLCYSEIIDTTEKDSNAFVNEKLFYAIHNSDIHEYFLIAIVYSRIQLCKRYLVILFL